MKLKEFMRTDIFAAANIVEYYNQSGKEVLFTTEVKRRKTLNKEVICCKSLHENNLKVLILILNTEV